MVDEPRSYPWLTVMVILVGLVSSLWVADRVERANFERPHMSRGAEQTPDVESAPRACMAAASRSLAPERRAAGRDRDDDPPMTEAPEDLEISEDYAWRGDLGIDTTLELDLNIAERPGSSKFEASTFGPPELHTSFDLFGPIDPALADGGDVSVPDPPADGEEGEKNADVENKIDELARTASKTLNRVDRLSRRFMDGARLTVPKDVRRRNAAGYPAEARVAPDWIRGNPGARLEISF